MPSAPFIFRFFLLVLLLQVVPVGLAFSGADPLLNLSAEELSWVKKHPVVRLAPDPDFPPLEYLEKDGTYRGIAADFVALIEKKLPFEIEIVRLESWSEVVRQAKTREIDMFGAAVPTPERLGYMLFTKPFVEFPAVVLVKDSDAEFPKLRDLVGKRVAVVANYADHEYMKRAYPQIPLDVVPDISSGLRQVAFGKVDAMILNIASASYYIAKDGITNLTITEDTDFIFDLSFASRSDWPLLNSILNKGLATVTPEERKAVLDKWISLNKQGWEPSPLFWVALLAALLLCSLLIILQWNRTLKQQVQERTKDLHTELEERLLAQKEREKLQLQISRSKKMEALGMLAGGVAHDLNNILSGVTGYAELMLMKLPEDSPFRRHVGAIQDSGLRAAAVVADMLTIARDVASDKTVADLNRLLREYLNSPEHAALVERFPELQFRAEMAADLLSVSCSTTHIKKMIMNLIVNAAEASETGEVRLITKNCYIDRPFGFYEDIKIGEYVLLQISDCGAGIASEDLEHIFEPFFTRKKLGVSGTGLGLAVVWNTVHDHHGYIDVEQLAIGSCFNIYLPITRAKISAEIQASMIDSSQGHSEHILVIDDEEQIRELATEMLSSLGYRVSTVSSGEEAIAFLRRETADLLLLDMIMEPGINGCQTYQQAVALHPGQKAIICSGFSESVEVQRAQSAGAGAYLKKPYTLQRLAQVVSDELAACAKE